MSELPGAAAAGTPLVVWFDEAGAAGATATAAGVVAGCCGLAGERPIGVTSAAGLASLVLLVGVVGANENNEPLPAGLDDSGEVQIELAGVPWSERANERSDIRATRERERCERRRARTALGAPQISLSKARGDADSTARQRVRLERQGTRGTRSTYSMANPRCRSYCEPVAAAAESTAWRSGPRRQPASAARQRSWLRAPRARRPRRSGTRSRRQSSQSKIVQESRCALAAQHHGEDQRERERDASGGGARGSDSSRVP